MMCFPERCGARTPMKVICLTTRGLGKASTHYRFVQFVDLFREAGVALEFVARSALNRERVAHLSDYDLVINQRCLLPRWQARGVLKRARRTVLDFDDAIYTRPGQARHWLTVFRVRARLRYWLARSDLTTVANGDLAEYARRWARRVEIVPMALDSRSWHPGERAPGPGPIRIGWSGSPSNLPQLERLGGVLAPLFSRRPDLRLAVLCGRRPGLPFAFDYHPFQSGVEPGFVRSLDIGVLPLVEDPFTRGKSPIKVVQYLSCGVPVVGNLFGGTAEMLDETNSVPVPDPASWPVVLEALADDRERRRRLGPAGLARFRDRHELRVVGRRWLALFRGEMT